jgi:hypothetical protein
MPRSAPDVTQTPVLPSSGRVAVTADGGMSIAPIEIKDKVIVALLELRHFVTHERENNFYAR